MKLKSGGRYIDVQDVTTIKTQDNQTLLEALESNNLSIHSQCRDGFCGACRTTLIAGSVEYITDPLAFIDDDEILPCCCYATKDCKIKVNF